MPKAKDDTKVSRGSKLDRRAILRGALAVGGASAVTRGASLSRRRPAEPEALVEREWARALARNISNQLPEAVSQVPNLGLTPDQLHQLQEALENTLITNMGCESSSG